MGNGKKMDDVHRNGQKNSATRYPEDSDAAEQVLHTKTAPVRYMLLCVRICSSTVEVYHVNCK